MNKAALPSQRIGQKARLKLAINFCSLLGIVILSVHIIISMLSSDISADYPGYYLMSMTNSVLATLLPSLVFASMCNGFKYCVRTFKKHTKPLDSFLLVAFGFCGCLSINMFSSFIESFLPDMHKTLYISFDAGPGSFILLTLATAVFPAICEEIAYRGFIYSTPSGYGHLFAVIFSSVIFGLMHSSISTAIFAFLCGILFGCIRKTSGIFILTVIIHFMNNAFSVVSTFIRLIYGKEVYSIFLAVSSNAAYILFIALFIILRHRRIRVFRFAKCPKAVTKSDKLVSVVSSPLFLAFAAAAMLLKFI